MDSTDPSDQSRVAAILGGLDAEQRAAVTVVAGPLAIVATAGSGKTTVLTRRMAYRVASGTADARHVLALTFTRDAAGELRRRLRRLDIREPIECGTFHSVALRLLRDRALSTSTAPPVVAPDRRRLVQESIAEVGIRVDVSAALGDLDWARARLVAPSDYGEACRQVRRRSAVPVEAFSRLVDAYEQLKRRRGVVDFDDLLGRVVDAARSDQTYAEVLHWRFRHLFVDESQDLNPMQHLLLEHLRGGSSDICLVGDPRQAVYGWNGADPSMLDEVEERYPGVTVLSLTSNHRCSPQIVRAGAAALAAIGRSDDSVARRPDGRSVSVLDVVDETGETTAVVEAVRDLVRRKGARQVAVLARTNDQLGHLSGPLTKAGIAIERSVGRSPLERVLAEVRRSNREQLAAWVDAISASGETDAIRLRVAAEVDRFLIAQEPGGFAAWVEVRQPFDDIEPEADDEGSVSLLTFHAAKGREWSGVVLVGIEDGLVPHSSARTQAQREEEGRLFYVAMTRAADELVLVHNDTRHGLLVAPSPWLSDVAASIGDDSPTAPPVAMRRSAPLVDPMAPLRAWRTGLARAAGLAETGVCSDRTLRTLHDDPPADAAAIAERLGIGLSAAERMSERLLRVLEESRVSGVRRPESA